MTEKTNEKSLVDLRAEIGGEISEAIQALGGGMRLLSIINSYGDTLDDEEILDLLEDYNSRHDKPELVLRDESGAPTAILDLSRLGKK